MGLFNSNDKVISELNERVMELEESKRSLMEEIKSNRQTISAFVGVKTDFEKQMTDLKNHHITEITGLKTELDNERKSIAKKVNKALANIGVNTFAPEEITKPIDKNPANIYSQFVGLTGEEKGKFFKANESTISKFVGLSGN